MWRSSSSFRRAFSRFGLPSGREFIFVCAFLSLSTFVLFCLYFKYLSKLNVDISTRILTFLHTNIHSRVFTHRPLYLHFIHAQTGLGMGVGLAAGSHYYFNSITQADTSSSLSSSSSSSSSMSSMVMTSNDYRIASTQCVIENEQLKAIGTYLDVWVCAWVYVCVCAHALLNMYCS